MSEPRRMAIEDLPRRVLDNLLEGCQVIGPDFRYLYVNDAVTKHGRTIKEHLLGRTMMDAYPGIEDTAMFAVLRRCMQERTSQTMENDFTFPDGSKTWFELRFEPGFEGVTILSVDITARRSAERALVRSNRAHATLSACNHALVRATDERQYMDDICRIAVERGGCRFAWIGLKEADAGCSIRPVAHAGHDGGYLDHLQVTWADTERGQGPTGRAIRSGRSAAARFIATDPQFEPWRKDALERGYASCIALPIRDGGECIGALMMYAVEPDAFNDEEQLLLDEMALDLSYGLTTMRARIASRRAETRAHEQLAESEARTKAIYDHLPSPTFVWQRRDNGFVLDAFNQAARIATHEGVADFLGRSPADLPHSYPELAEDLERCFQQRVPIKRELEHGPPRAKGPRRLVATYGFIPPDMVVQHTEDVTEQRQTEEQLRIAQRMEAIGRLAGGVAHDFNNLLSVILSYSSFGLEDVGEGDPLQNDLLEIKRAAERAARLTSQLLAFSRKQVLRPARLDLNRVVSEMDGMLRRIIGEDVELTLMAAHDLGVVLADPSQVEQVIMNLVVNARDAMPYGGKLTIKTADVEIDEGYAAEHVDVRPGPYVALTVTDSGCGMDEATQARIFEPFFTTKGPQKGTGLGLSTVYGIVKQSGGNVWVYSEPGHGTTFKIYLPRAHGTARASSRPAPSVASARGTETILVVEDEPALGTVVKRILSAAGYAVLVATSGSEALTICEGREDDIHLVLTDVIMPQMSGKAFAEQLAKVRPETKVLYMSGYTDDAIVHHGVLDAGTQFIGKPFNAGDLMRKVREVLDAVQSEE